MDLIITSLPGQFVDIHSPDRLSDHDIVSGTLKVVIPPIKKPKRKIYRYQKGDYESMRKDTLKFAKEKYFNGHSDTRSVQENFNLMITSFIQDSADKHIPSKTSRSVSSVPWITPEIRRKIRKKNETRAKAKRTGSAKIRSKFEHLRREIKADIKKQHDLYVNNLVGDVKANPRDFYRYINSQKKDTQGIPPLKKRQGSGLAQSDFEKASEFNGQFTDVFTKSEHSQVPLLDRSAPFMENIVVTKEGVTKLGLAQLIVISVNWSIHHRKRLSMSKRKQSITYYFYFVKKFMKNYNCISFLRLQTIRFGQFSERGSSHLWVGINCCNEVMKTLKIYRFLVVLVPSFRSIHLTYWRT